MAKTVKVNIIAMSKFFKNLLFGVDFKTVGPGAHI